LAISHTPPHASGKVIITWGQHGRIAIQGNKKLMIIVHIMQHPTREDGKHHLVA